MLEFKSNAHAKDLSPQALLAIHVAEQAYEGAGYLCVVTSINDSKHSDGSKHYEGDAIDLRTRHVQTQSVVEAIANSIRARLPKGFQVIVEETHIHIEWDPA